MRRFLSIMAAVGLSAGIGLAMTSGGAGARAAEVTVVRGAQIETVTPGAKAAQRVAVFRGEIPRKAPASEGAAPAAATWSVVGGDRLWMVDTTHSRIIACYLAKTTQVSEHAIRCVDTDPR